MNINCTEQESEASDIDFLLNQIMSEALSEDFF
jgi:hypothetical protein